MGSTMTASKLAWGVRRAPMLAETLLTYARTRRRMARESDVRKLLAAARRGQTGQSAPESLREARRLAYAVSLTLAVLPNDPRCLVRSLVLIELLARREIAATLVIGTSASSDFSAHAWVELNGEALLPPAGYGVGRLAEL